MIELKDYQIDAVNNLGNGKILCGAVGTGKSRTALAYYFFKVCKADAPINGKGKWSMMKEPRDLYVITTAKKRDSQDWEIEARSFNISTNQDNSINGVNFVVDSWNNIKKYEKIYGAFFIFDEQRVVGKGAWVKSFLNITRKNKWILLSATPGDSWTDYIPVFVANGFYKNRTEFNTRHCVFSRYAKFPKVDKYIDVGILLKHRKDLLVDMESSREILKNRFTKFIDYDRMLYFTVAKARWDPWEKEPIPDAARMCYLLRRVVNDSSFRTDAILDIYHSLPDDCKRAIVFYNFDYELYLLRDVCDRVGITYAEWNGHKHEETPKSESWLYLVNYAAGAEGWNCIETNTIIFYSLNYSYRTTVQAEGRIDRMNTTYKYLNYYYITTKAPIDVAINRALHRKKTFNEKDFVGNLSYS